MNTHYILVGLFVVVYILCVILLTWNSVLTAVANKTLAPPRDLQAKSFRQDYDCSVVNVGVKSSYNADLNGNWDTAKAYQKNESIYSVEFTGAVITTDQYVNAVSSFKKELKSLGEQALKHDYMWNLVAWTSYRYVDSSSELTFSMHSNAASQTFFLMNN